MEYYLPDFVLREWRESMEYYLRDLDVLREWRESCPELRDLWREDDHGNWEGVIWSLDGRRVIELRIEEVLSGPPPRLEGLTSLECVLLDGNQLSSCSESDSRIGPEGKRLTYTPQHYRA